MVKLTLGWETLSAFEARVIFPNLATAKKTLK